MIALNIENIDPLTSLIKGVELSIRPNSEIKRTLELTGACSRRSERLEQIEVAVEFLDNVFPEVTDENIAEGINGNTTTVRIITPAPRPPIGNPITLCVEHGNPVPMPLCDENAIMDDRKAQGMI